MYQLHHNIYSPPSRRVISLLEQAELSYEATSVDLSAGGHMQPEFVQLNPNHQVPTMFDSEVELRIHESHAVMRYLCVKHELYDWYPCDTKAYGQVEQWLDWTTCQMARATESIVLNQVFLGDQGDQAAIEQGKKKLEECWVILDAALVGRQYLVGDKPTIADLSLASCVFQLSFAGIKPTTDNVVRWYANIFELKGFQASLPST